MSSVCVSVIHVLIKYMIRLFYVKTNHQYTLLHEACVCLLYYPRSIFIINSRFIVLCVVSKKRPSRSLPEIPAGAGGPQGLQQTSRSSQQEGFQKSQQEKTTLNTTNLTYNAVKVLN